MKITLRFLLVLATVLFLSFHATAQVAQQENADTLRERIKQAEAMNVSTSAFTQNKYKRYLHDLYTRFGVALKKDISDLKALEVASGQADPESQKEIARLSAELNRVTRRIQTLETELGITPAATITTAEGETAAAQNSAKPAALIASNASPAIKSSTDTSVIPVADSLSAREPARSNSASTANQAGNAPATMVRISGRVTVINEHFFKNPERFTSDQIKEAVEARSGRRAASRVQLRIETEADAKGRGNEDLAANNILVIKKEYAQKLNVPLVNVKVVIRQNGINDEDSSETNNEVAFTKTDREGRYSLLVPANAGNYTISVSVENFSVEQPFSIETNGTVIDADQMNLQLLVRPLGEYSRAIVGFEQAGASSAKSVQRFFFDLTLSAPFFRGSVHPYFGRKGRIWGTVRVTSIPQQITTPVGQFATGFAQQVSNVKVNEVAQAIEVLAGGEYRLTNKMFTFGSFDGKTANKFTLALIGGVGATTPLNPRDTLEIFTVFPGAPGLPPLPPGTQFIAFVSPDRDRFFRQFYIGFRMQGYYFDYKNSDIPLQRYPASLDLTYGQNEAVTGGRLRGGVIRLEGFYPLPYEDLKFINLFGTAIIKPTRTRITNPLILQPAPAGTVVPAPNVFIQTVPQINRDYYRVGVGIDFIQLVKQIGVGSGNSQ